MPEAREPVPHYLISTSMDETPYLFFAKDGVLGMVSHLMNECKSVTVYEKGSPEIYTGADLVEAGEIKCVNGKYMPSTDKEPVNGPR